VTSIEIPDLQMIYSLVIQDIPTLTLISMPKLEEIWHGLSLLQRRNPPIEADFRALRRANDFGFDGLFTRYFPLRHLLCSLGCGVVG
jgi:hypothetical protein